MKPARAEVAVRRRALVDRALEVEVTHDGAGAQVEHRAHGLLDHGGVDVRRAERLDEDADRVRHADGVGDLHLAAVGSARRDDVLGDPTAGVGTRTVDLARILAGEGTATVATHAAVRVDDDLAAGEAGVGVRATEHELTGRVHVDLVVVVGELLGDDRADDLLDEIGTDDRVAVDAVLVLRADQHGLERHRPAVVVLVGDLGLAVGAQVRDLTGLADLGEALGEAMRHPDRQRHQVGGLVAGVAEHHALVAGALQVEAVLAGLARADLLARVDALGDVGALLVDRDDDAAGVAVEAVAARCRNRFR